MSEWRHSVLYNVISGAVKNTLDGHPDWIVPKEFARSVAKRAAGTLAGMNPGAAGWSHHSIHPRPTPADNQGA